MVGVCLSLTFQKDDRCSLESGICGRAPARAKCSCSLPWWRRDCRQAGSRGKASRRDRTHPLWVFVWKIIAVETGFDRLLAEHAEGKKERELVE